jgi:hypothetical protein
MQVRAQSRAIHLGVAEAHVGQPLKPQEAFDEQFGRQNPFARQPVIIDKADKLRPSVALFVASLGGNFDPGAYPFPSAFFVLVVQPAGAQLETRRQLQRVVVRRIAVERRLLLRLTGRRWFGRLALLFRCPILSTPRRPSRGSAFLLPPLHDALDLAPRNVAAVL